MPDPPLLLPPPSARRYAETVGRALDALRLNRQFPDWERIRAHVEAAAAAPDGLRLDPASGLPAPRAWIRARVEAELAGTADRALAGRDVHVALRHLTADEARYAIRVDRLDLATATVARYTLAVSDRPGRIVSVGELELQAEARFRARLELLTTQDAGLAFAVLRDQEGLSVEEVVRGVVGPAVVGGDPVDGGHAGPEALRGLVPGLVLSACLERASLDASPHVDDPLATSVVVPRTDRFGVSRARKWAAPAPFADRLRAWLAERGSRGLVYAYEPVA